MAASRAPLAARWVAISWPRREARTRSASRASRVKAGYSLRCGYFAFWASLREEGASRSHWPSLLRAPSVTVIPPSFAYTSCWLVASVVLTFQTTVFRSIHWASALARSRFGAPPTVGSRYFCCPDRAQISWP